MSINTQTNASEVLKILQEKGIEDVAILTVGFHLPRSEKVFAQQGISATGLVSEDLLIGRSSMHYGPLMERFKKSGRVKMEQGKELLLRAALVFDPKGKLPQLLTSKIRNSDR